MGTGPALAGARPVFVDPGVAPSHPGEPVALPRGWRRLHRRQKLVTACGWMMNVGVIIILFAAWQVWGTSISQHQAQQSLGRQFRAHLGHSASPAAPQHLTAASAHLAQPAEGSVVARLQIPAIGVDEYVVQGTAEGDLAKGPGHYVGTAMPGQAGNVAVAGHRTTYGAPFNNLDQLTPGDPVVLTSQSGTRLEYVVSHKPVAVAPSDVAVLRPFGDNRLTLTTCNPRFSASQRLVVVAALRSSVVKSTASASAPAKPATLVGGGGSVGWNLVYLPAVLAVIAVMVLLGLMDRRAARYHGRFGRWIILGPIWVAAVYVLFELLSSLLPATL